MAHVERHPKPVHSLDHFGLTDLLENPLHPWVWVDLNLDRLHRPVPHSPPAGGPVWPRPPAPVEWRRMVIGDEGGGVRRAEGTCRVLDSGDGYGLAAGHHARLAVLPLILPTHRAEVAQTYVVGR